MTVFEASQRGAQSPEANTARLVAVITAATNDVLAEHVANLGTVVEVVTDGIQTRVLFTRQGQTFVMTAHPVPPVPGGFLYEIKKEQS